MDKSNSSQEELLYLPPTYMNKKRGQEVIKEKGFATVALGVVGPAFRENPFPFIGISLTMGAFGRCIYYEFKGQRERASTMLKYKSCFALFTFLSVAAGLACRDYKADKLAEEHKKLYPEDTD